MNDVIVVTPERQAVLDLDVVHQFVERVNEAAIKKPYWSKDFRRAHYDAFVEEVNKHCIEVLRFNGLL